MKYWKSGRFAAQLADQMCSLPVRVLSNRLSMPILRHNFVEKTRKLFCLKSIKNQYRVSLSSLLLKNVPLTVSSIRFLRNIDIVVTFKVPSAQLCYLLQQR